MKKVFRIILALVILCGCGPEPVNPILKRDNELRNVVFSIAEEFEQGFDRQEAEKILLQDIAGIIKTSRSKGKRKVTADDVIDYMFGEGGYTCPDKWLGSGLFFFLRRDKSKYRDKIGFDFPILKVLKKKEGVCFELSLILRIFLNEFSIENIVITGGNHSFVRYKEKGEWINIETTSDGEKMPLSFYYKREGNKILMSCNKEDYTQGGEYDRDDNHLAAMYLYRMVNEKNIKNKEFTQRVEKKIKELKANSVLGDYYIKQAYVASETAEEEWLHKALKYDDNIEREASKFIADLEISRRNYKASLYYLDRYFMHGNFPVEALFDMVWIYQKTGEYDKAFEKCNKILNSGYCISNNKLVKVYKFKSHMYLKTKKYKEAISCYIAMMEKVPYQYNILIAIGNVYLMMDEYDKALKYYSLFIVRNESRGAKPLTDEELKAVSDVYKYMGEAYNLKNDIDRAEEFLIKGLENNRNDGEIYLSLIRLLLTHHIYDEKKREEMREYCDAFLKLRSEENKDKIPVYRSRIQYYRMEGKTAEYIDDAHRIMEIYSGLNKTEKNKFEYSVSKLKNLLHITYKNVLKQAEDFNKKGKYKECIGITTRYMSITDEEALIRKYGKDVYDIYFARAQAYRKTGENDKALADMKKARSIIDRVKEKK